MLQGLCESHHFLTVQLAHLGMEERGRLVCCLKLRLQLFPASVERLDLRLTFFHCDFVVQHQVQQLPDPRADSLDLAFRGGSGGAAFHPEPVHLAGELVAEFFEQILLKQLFLKRAEDSRLNFVAPDGQMVVAPSLVARAKASEAVLARHDESSATYAAFRQSREQVLWTLGRAEGTGRLHRVPDLLLP